MPPLSGSGPGHAWPTASTRTDVEPYGSRIDNGINRVSSLLCFELHYLYFTRSIWLCVFVSAGT
jgi:hypothetical protein